MRKNTKPIHAVFVAGTARPGFPNALARGETGAWTTGNWVPPGVTAVRLIQPGALVLR